MRCPLCGGPLTKRAENLFTCEVGHALDAGGVHESAIGRATVALWMAINALEGEAEALRVLAGGNGSTAGELVEQADQADSDATLLRQLASSHDRVAAE